MGRIDDKVVIITGGASGIGEGCVRRLASEGGKIVFGDINEAGGCAIERELNALGQQVKFVKADVTSPEDNERLVEETVKRFGTIDGIVCNAGGGPMKPVHEYSIAEWRNSFELNFNSGFYLSKYAIPAMLKNGGGSIVFMGSASTAKLVQNMSNYAPAKSAMYQLARCISLENCRVGIRANVVSPGATLTALYQNNPGSEVIAACTAPTNRLALPSEIASCVLFLISDDSKIVTGTNIYPDMAYSCGIMYDQVVGLNAVSR